MESATITLNNGVAIPRVGLGTFRARGADVQAAVKAALAAGIRHIDTASIYKVRRLRVCASGFVHSNLLTGVSW